MSPFLLDCSNSECADTTDLDTVVGQIFSPNVYVREIYPLEGHLHSMCLVILSNEEQLLLKSTPGMMTPLLRQEQRLLETEAQAMFILKQSAVSCIPAVLHYDHRGNLFGSSFILRQFVPGTTLQELEAQLGDQTRTDIDWTLGSLANSISQHVSHSFGSLEQVASGSGKRSWREAFIILFEGILRDSEDVFVNLPYAEIRHQVCRLSPALEEVRLARLVVVDLGRPSQVLLDPESKRVAGVVDFSSALWGDVYMADIFDNPSSSVLDGFGLRPTKSKAESIRHLLSTVAIDPSRGSQYNTIETGIYLPKMMQEDD
ncbi:hypothetical protein P170DRAFT_117455 [Aspergillus steynii IBT 23096]|uniref:Aminoglycoside phosphotransferase domain-containing protein n=1 Tax=Aspergillus steynii IBT 23096 TaxID=1392250 RepID=A0A2I2GJ64_9EURO|nr:uncharacterized protein P170DRAFT_117455 [Aspergillus steynii IBT 23096]PLB52921.1 hypothetical protein P170DRAFT_117455 [Aspergillus steynii IBT 23096]